MIDYMGMACHGCGEKLPKNSFAPLCAECRKARLDREYRKLVEAFGEEKAAEIAETTGLLPGEWRIAR